tara:strand:+ start:2726 stop:3643 length:918 start_codon:yes stop_codon:yes gene_type:complete
MSITYANAYNTGNGARMLRMINQELNLTLADTTNLLTYDGVLNVGSVDGSGSDTLSQAFANMGSATSFASTADADEVTATDPTFSNVDFQIGRYALRHDVTSWAQMTGGGLDPFAISQYLMMSAIATASDVIAGTFSSFTDSVGSSGVDLSVDDMLDAIFKLENANNSQFAAILHSVQFADFRQSLRSESNNAFAFAPASMEIMKAKAPGYVGEWGGVQIYKSNRVTEATGNKIGAMIGANAIGYVLGTPQNTQLGDGSIIAQGTPAIIEWDRKPAFDMTSIIGNLYIGANVVEDTRGVKIVTDA